MKYAPIILSAVTVFALSTILFAFAQTPADNDGIRYVYAQNIIRNAKGQLISYLETYRVTITNFEALNSIADYEVNVGKKEFVITEIDGIPHQWIKINRPVTFDVRTVQSVTFLGTKINDTWVSCAIFPTDGYSIDAGDELTTRWTVVRSVQ